jgi:serine/threonine protein kinase
VLFKHAYEAPPKLTVLVPTLHPSIDDVLARMLAKRPADRFSSVAEVTSALLESDRNTFRGVFDQAPLHERPESVLPRSSASHQALGASGRFGSRWVWAIAAVVLVLAVSIAIAARSLIHGDDASTVVASSPSTTSSDAPEPVSPPVRDVEATAPATVLPELGPSKPLPPVPIEEQADATSNPPIAASGEDEPTLITTPADPAPSKSEQDAAREGAKFRAAQKVRWQRELKRLIGDACEVYMAKTITITKLQLGTAAVDASPRKLRDCVLNVIPRGLPADKYKITISPTNPAEGEPHANTADPFK